MCSHLDWPLIARLYSVDVCSSIGKARPAMMMTILLTATMMLVAKSSAPLGADPWTMHEQDQSYNTKTGLHTQQLTLGSSLEYVNSYCAKDVVVIVEGW